MTIAVFLEGGDIMIGAAKDEFNCILDDGAKLQLSTAKAKLLVKALQDKLDGIDAVKRLEDGSSTSHQDLVTAQLITGSTKI